MNQQQLAVEEARRKLGDLVTAAAQTGQVTVVSKGGIPAAAIVPLQFLYESQPRDAPGAPCPGLGAQWVPGPNPGQKPVCPECMTPATDLGGPGGKLRNGWARRVPAHLRP
jgi:prevent-host-death family protein